MDTQVSTRERILEAATAVFVESGYDGARMDVIARRAGVNKAGIYYHIGGKWPLYSAVLERVFSPVADELESLYSEKYPDERPTEEKLVNHIERIAHNLDLHPEMPRIILWEMAASGGKELPEAVQHEISRIVKITSRIVEQGQQEKIFRKINPFLAHMLIIGPMIFLKASTPLRSESGVLPATANEVGSELAEKTAPLLAELVISALRTPREET